MDLQTCLHGFANLPTWICKLVVDSVDNLKKPVDNLLRPVENLWIIYCGFCGKPVDNFSESVDNLLSIIIFFDYILDNM